MFRTKYPRAVYTAKTTTKTLTVEPALIAASAFGDDERRVESPYLVFDSTFSRFKFVILNLENGKYKPYTANVKAANIAGIIRNSEAAKNADSLLTTAGIRQFFDLSCIAIKKADGIAKGLQNLYFFMKYRKLPEKTHSQDANLIKGEKAKNVQIRSGIYKGKTPYEVLAGDSSQKDGLLKQKAWLAGNLGKYPMNQEQIDAIDEAILMLDKGQLGSHAAEKGMETTQLKFGDILLYSSGPRPLQRKMGDDGYCPVKEMSITWHIGKDYPVEINISNYDATIIKRDNGAINVETSKKRNEVKTYFNISSDGWFDCLSRIQRHMDLFGIYNMTKQFKEADEADRQNRAESAGQGQQY